MVTLRGDRMYEFFDRLVNVALPRVRDFRGVSSKSFDGRGNYTLGVKDQLIFPEIDYSKVEKTKGMNISHHHHGAHRRRGSGAAAPDGDAVPAIAIGEERTKMATTAKIAKDIKLEVARKAKTPKLQCRHRNRCWRCGRPRAFLRSNT